MRLLDLYNHTDPALAREEEIEIVVQVNGKIRARLLVAADAGEPEDILHGQGFAYARYMHSKWPGFGAAWAAWVADVEVNRSTGEVHVTGIDLLDETETCLYGTAQKAALRRRDVDADVYDDWKRTHDVGLAPGTYNDTITVTAKGPGAYGNAYKVEAALRPRTRLRRRLRVPQPPVRRRRGRAPRA